jgi:hypothetical protein
MRNEISVVSVLTSNDPASAAKKVPPLIASKKVHFKDHFCRH